MSLVFIDGFDHYVSGAGTSAATGDIGLKWDEAHTSFSNIAVGTSFGRHSGSQGIRFTDSQYIHKNLPSGSSFVIGFAFKPTAIPLNSFDRIIAVFNKDSTNLQELQIDSTGHLFLTKGGSSMPDNTASGALAADTWVYIEWKVTISSSAGASTNVVSVNGTPVITLDAAQNTDPAGSGAANRIYLGPVSGGALNGDGYYIDDFYVLANDGTNHTDFLGDSRVVTLYPNGAGASALWSPTGAGSNYAAVNEAQEDGDSTYVATTTVSTTDSYALGDLPYNPASISGVQTVAWAKYPSSSGSIELKVVASGVGVLSGTAATLGSSYAAVMWVWEENPDGGSDWTTSDVNGMEAGFRLDSGTGRVTQLVAEVLASTAVGGASTFSVSATTAFTVSPSSDGRIPVSYSVSASNAMVVGAGGTATVHNPTNYAVSASTAFVVADRAGGSVPHFYTVAAGTHVTLWATASEYVSPILVCATTAFRLSGPAAGTAIGDRPVSAATALTIAQAATLGRLAIIHVSAATGFGLSGAASEVRSAVAAAASALVASAAARQNRDISVAATTGVGLSSDPTSNGHFDVAALGSVAIAAAAGVRKTGTEAQSALVFVDLAQAVVWLPWRRSGLALPPGGNLPHS
jgi:hypothetical protein